MALRCVIRTFFWGSSKSICPGHSSFWGPVMKSAVIWSCFRNMAGHSKWQNIRHIKAAKDAEKSRINSKHSRLIRMAVSVGGTDPKLNSKLAAAVENARAANVPSTTIENSIKKGGSVKIREAMYALMGPNNCYLLVDVESENISLTTHSIKQLCRRHSANIIDEVRAKQAFLQKGVITVESEADAIPDASSNEVLEMAIESGAEDVEGTTDETGKQLLQFICAPDDLFKVKKNLESAAKYSIREAKVHFIPQRTVPLSDEEMEVIGKLCASLEELPEVVEVYDNVQ